MFLVVYETSYDSTLYCTSIQPKDLKTFTMMFGGGTGVNTVRMAQCTDNELYFSDASGGTSNPNATLLPRLLYGWN